MELLGLCINDVLLTMCRSYGAIEQQTISTKPNGVPLRWSSLKDKIHGVLHGALRPHQTDEKNLCL
jgi:hypothetical protein